MRKTLYLMAVLLMLVLFYGCNKGDYVFDYMKIKGTWKRTLPESYSHNVYYTFNITDGSRFPAGTLLQTSVRKESGEVKKESARWVISTDEDAKYKCELIIYKSQNIT